MLGMVEAIIQFANQQELSFQDFQNVGIAFLTILIPLGIAVLTEYFRKLDSKEDLVVLDLHVILDWILQFKCLLKATGLVFIPGLFWSYYQPLTKYAVMFGWIVGTIFFITILLRFYEWTKGSKEKHRLGYYQSLNNLDDFTEVSKSIWSANNLAPRQEVAYFSVFARKLEELTHHE